MPRRALSVEPIPCERFPGGNAAPRSVRGQLLIDYPRHRRVSFPIPAPADRESKMTGISTMGGCLGSFVHKVQVLLFFSGHHSASRPRVAAMLRPAFPATPINPM